MNERLELGSANGRLSVRKWVAKAEQLYWTIFVTGGQSTVACEISGSILTLRLVARAQQFWVLRDVALARARLCRCSQRVRSSMARVRRRSTTIDVDARVIKRPRNPVDERLPVGTCGDIKIDAARLCSNSRPGQQLSGSGVAPPSPAMPQPRRAAALNQRGSCDRA